jgi:hypothetical protein
MKKKHFSKKGKRQVWQVLKKGNIELPYDPVIVLLGTEPKLLKAGTQTSTCAPVSIATQFIMAKGWKQPSVHHR